MPTSNRFSPPLCGWLAGFRDTSKCLRVIAVLATIVLGLLSSPSLLAQGSIETSVFLTITPTGSNSPLTYNEAVGLTIWLRDYNENGIGSSTVTYSVDAGPTKTATTNSGGFVYVNLGQQSIGTHTITASYAGSGNYEASNANPYSYGVSDAPFQFVGTQGTTLFGDGAVSDVEGVAVDPQDNLYISDKSKNVVKKEDAFGNITTIPLTGLNKPIGLVFDSAGNLYIADSGNKRVLEYDTSGNQTVVPVAGLTGPTYLAYDTDNDLLYVADPSSGKILEYKTSDKTTTTAVSGLTGLRSIGVAQYGALVYADQVTGFFQIGGLFTLGSQTPLFAPIVEAGGIATRGTNIVLSDQSTNSIYSYGYSYGDQLQINNAGNPAEGMAIDSKGRVYLALGGRVDVLAPASGRAPDYALASNSLVSLLFEEPQAKPTYSVTAPSATSTFHQPSNVGCPGTGGVCSTNVHFTPQIAGVNTGSVTVTEGSFSGPLPLWGNGIGPAAAFTPGVNFQNVSDVSKIGGVAYDLAGNTYVSDSANNIVKKITPQFATSTLGFTGLSTPTQLAVDGSGAVYVLDSGNNRIERLDTAGNQVDAYAADSEELDIQPIAFAIDGDGYLVIAGPGGNLVGNAKRAKAQHHGKHVTAAAQGSGDYSIYYLGRPTIGSAASPFSIRDVADNLPDITAVAVDGAGYIYATDTGGHLTSYAPDNTPKTLSSSLGQQPVAVAVDASQTVYVAESGSGSIQLIHNDGTTDSLGIPGLANPASFAMNGYGNLLTADTTTLQLLYVDRTRQDYFFGSAQVGASLTQHGSLTNIGNQPYSINDTNNGSIPADAEFVQVSSSTECSQGATGEPAATTLAPDASCDLSYTFTPPSANSYTDSGTVPTTPVTFTGTPGAGLISLSGNGTSGSGTFTISPTTQVFPDTPVSGTSVTMTSTISNTTPVGVYLGKPSLSDGTDFTQTSNCGNFLNAGNGSCTVTFTFTPKSTGPLTSTYSIYDEDHPNNILKVALSGNGTAAVAPAISISPSKLSFPLTVAGGVSAPLTLTVTNNGGATANLKSAQLGAPQPGAFAVTDGCGATLAPKSSCTLSVVFEPYAPSTTYTSSVTVASDDPNSPAVATVTGTSSPVASPSAALTPSSADYGSVTVGTTSAAKTFTLTNTGTAALPLNVVGISGANISSFALTGNTCISSLAAGASCTISISFTPTATGTATASLTVIDSVGTQTSTLTGNGTMATPTAPAATLTPSSLNFGSVQAGTKSTAQTATLTSTGTAPLSITGIQVGGTNAAVFASTNNCGATLAVGASCTISISFTPAAAGTFSASLTVIDSVGTQTSTLTGNGTMATPTVPAATLTPSSLSFGSVQTGTKSTAQTATLTSTGTAPLAITGIQVGGTNAGVFVSTNTCGTSLAVGSSCTISVTFDPTAAGSDTATISVADNASGSPQTVALTGTATAPPPAADFTIAATPSMQTVDAGSSANYTVSLNSSGSTFTDPVTLTISGLPAGATATFTPSSVTPGTAGASSMLTVQTAVQQAALDQGKSRWPLGITVVSTALLILPFRRRKRISSLLMSVGLLLVSVVSLTACSGGFAVPSKPQPSSTTYTLTVTGASGTTQHSTTVQITVR